LKTLDWQKKKTWISLPFALEFPSFCFAFPSFGLENASSKFVAAPSDASDDSRSVRRVLGTVPRTRLVVIGAAGRVDESLLEAAFASCAEASNFLAVAAGSPDALDPLAIDKVR
jgi:hypothetical protein